MMHENVSSLSEDLKNTKLEIHPNFLSRYQVQPNLYQLETAQLLKLFKGNQFLSSFNTHLELSEGGHLISHALASIHIYTTNGKATG